MLLGPGGVGKTSLKRGLMGLEFDSRMNSTIVAEVQGLKPVSRDDGILTDDDALEREWVTPSGMVENEWKEITKEDEIRELAELIGFVEDVTSRDSKLKQKKESLDIDVPQDYYDTVKGLMNTEILDEAFKQAKQMKSEKRPPPKPSPFFHMWDCGGQPVFQEVLPVFLTSRTMFLLLFNATRDLNTFIESVQYRFGEKIQQGFVNMTTLQLLEGWMSNIHSYLLKKDNEGSYLEYPRVIPVGTRGDQLTEPEKEAVLEGLMKSSYDKSFCKVLKKPVIIDNTKAGRGRDEDPTYQILRDAISNFAIRRLTEVTPITWVLYRKVLQLVCCGTEKRNIITLDEAKAIGITCKVPPSAVSSVLRFYHELGVLLYYPSIPGLQDKVILDPKWFVECLGMVLTLPGVGREEIERRLEWDLLRTKGILVKPLYVAVWRGCQGVKPDDFIQLLVAFQLAVQIKTDEYDDSSVDQYFIPAVLPYFTDGDAQRPNSTAPVHITFKSGYVTPGFFTRLITTMAKHPRCNLYFNDGIYHNKVTFRFGKTAANLVTFTATSGVIAVGVHRLGSDMPHELQQDCIELMNLCEVCSESVEECIQPYYKLDDITTLTRVPRDTRVVCQYEKCQSEGAGLHYLTSSPHNNQICCSHDSITYREITRMEGYWYESVDMAAIFNVSESPDNEDEDSIDYDNIPRARPNPADVFQYLQPMAYEYDTIGRELGVAYGFRVELSRAGIMISDQQKLERVIYEWAESECSEVSWKGLLQVLKRCRYMDTVQSLIKYLTTDPNAILKYNN